MLPQAPPGVKKRRSPGILGRLVVRAVEVIRPEGPSRLDKNVNQRIMTEDILLSGKVDRYHSLLPPYHDD